ncbi:MAG: alpha/beta fold hydrolase [Myxococcota bacterium]
MTTVEAADGVQLYAEAHGGGVPLIFSCALNTTHENWRLQISPLVDAGIRVILWDYRGHGLSESPPEASAYSIDHVVDDLARVHDWAAQGEPAVLAGLSFGGLASLHFALRHPERVRGLVLVDSGPGFKNPKAQENWARATERTATFIESRGMEAFVQKAVATTVGGKPELPEARAAARAIAAQNPAGLAHFARRVAGRTPPVIDELVSIDCPALVVVGEKDEPYLQAALVMTAKLPRAHAFTVPGAGHIVNIEAAEVFNAEVIRFLSQFSPA